MIVVIRNILRIYYNYDDDNYDAKQYESFDDNYCMNYHEIEDGLLLNFEIYILS